MAKYRKKPIVIEAVQFHPWMDPWPEGVEPPSPNERGTGYGYIQTLEGRMMVSAGDWVITGVAGERYPCKPDIFEATYVPVETSTVEDRAKEFAEDVKRHRVRMP